MTIINTPDDDPNPDAALRDAAALVGAELGLFLAVHGDDIPPAEGELLAAARDELERIEAAYSSTATLEGECR